LGVHTKMQTVAVVSSGIGKLPKVSNRTSE